MKTVIKKLLLFKGILLLTGLFLFAPFVNAQSSVSLSISPLSFELTANPGDVLTSEVKIFNQNDSPLPVTIGVEDFTAVGETGSVRLEEKGNETYSLAKWIKVYPENIILEPNERRTITFEIAVPSNGEAGGHYGSVVASAGGRNNHGSEDGYGSAISIKVSSLILLNVSGEVVEDVEVLSFDVPKFQEYGPVLFETRFENKGTVHVKPRGFITITDMFGNKVKDLEFPSKNILPGAKRKIETSWNTKWLFGKYTATLIGSYGTSNTPLNLRVVTFTVFPWRLASYVLAVILFILIILFLSRKRLKLAARILLKGER